MDLDDQGGQPDPGCDPHPNRYRILMNSCFYVRFLLLLVRHLLLEAMHLFLVAFVVEDLGGS